MEQIEKLEPRRTPRFAKKGGRAMTRTEQIRFLTDILLTEMPEYRAQAERFAAGADPQRRLLRSLMNVRPPLPLKSEFLAVQDELLSAEREERGVAAADSLFAAGSKLALWQGDITRLAADAIVNAGNSALLGCFHPCHGCIDNAIHSAAGLQLRGECAELMKRQGHEEPVGQAKITRAYNLPCRYVIHTVGPVWHGGTQGEPELLASCYRSSIELAGQLGLRSIAFPSISTGVYGYPIELAAPVAVSTVRQALNQCPSIQDVRFCCFSAGDMSVYQAVLGNAAV